MSMSISRPRSEGIGAAASQCGRTVAPNRVPSRFDRDTAVTALPDGGSKLDGPGLVDRAGPQRGVCGRRRPASPGHGGRRRRSLAALLHRALPRAPGRGPRADRGPHGADGPDAHVRVRARRAGRAPDRHWPRPPSPRRCRAPSSATCSRPTSCRRTPSSRWSCRGAPVVPLRERYEMRWAVGPLPFSGAPQAVAGGWIRLRPTRAPRRRPRPDRRHDRHVDAARLHPLDTPMAVPTIDLTIHFRSPIPPLVGAWFLARVPLADGDRRVRGGRRRGLERRRPAAGPLPPARTGPRRTGLTAVTAGPGWRPAPRPGLAPAGSARRQGSLAAPVAMRTTVIRTRITMITL